MSAAEADSCSCASGTEGCQVTGPGWLDTAAANFKVCTDCLAQDADPDDLKEILWRVSLSCTYIYTGYQIPDGSQKIQASGTGSDLCVAPPECENAAHRAVRKRLGGIRYVDQYFSGGTVSVTRQPHRVA